MEGDTRRFQVLDSRYYHVPVTRWILHADLDAFYASVEQLDNPELRGKPVVVGGPPEARAVVTTASYEARVFGVHSAMPMSRALRLCPQAVRVSPRFGRYGEVSREVMAVFRALTPLVEPLSLDEAFLDVTQQAQGGRGAESIARALKDEVRRATGLTLSIGAAANKSVAKIASDIGKPDGLVVVAPGEEAAFLAPLPVRALWGIGPRTDVALAAAGIRTVGDLAAAPPAQLERLLGSRSEFLREMANGIDDRPVETEHERKSVGAETTFARDLADGPDLRAALGELALQVSRRLRGEGVRARTAAIKLRYANFHTITRQVALPAPIDRVGPIMAVASQLLDRVVADGGGRFRLLGIHCSRLDDRAATPAPTGDAQRELWPESVSQSPTRTK